MITDADLRQAINGAGFPLKKRDAAVGIVAVGLEQFREYEKNWYYGRAGFVDL